MIMASWSRRRKLAYALIALIIIVGAIIVPGFLLIYRPPTCSDGIKNGDEQGIDCGGSCERLCQNVFLSPIVNWVRYEEIYPGVYNLAAYIENPNPDVEAVNVPYHMVVYGPRALELANKTGTVTIPPHRPTLAFVGAVNLGKVAPVTSPFFEFTAAPEWHKRADPLAALSIGGQNYQEDETGSSMTVTLKNSSVQAIYRVAVYVILYDKDKNVIGFSKTIVDQIPPLGSAVAPFTWPINRHGAVISQEVLPVAE
ncbi:MAG: hypothetical protein QOG91_256 [Candidatus Parcubacteria bacterium]|jgi:hypothetical protein|nr:hypothetical protein [Candidatus Parcubacteria bacterium]